MPHSLIQGFTNFPNIWSHLKIQCATIQNLVAQVTWFLGFEQPWPELLSAMLNKPSTKAKLVT